MSRFEEIEHGTVLDQETGLEWQAKPTGPMTWDEAMNYAENLDLGGYNDWRLPTIEELETLVDREQANPASAFPGMPSERFWSSSVVAYGTSGAWRVGFTSGYVNYYDKGSAVHVCCVRRGLLKLQYFDASERIRELEAENRRLRGELDGPGSLADRAECMTYTEEMRKHAKTAEIQIIKQEAKIKWLRGVLNEIANDGCGMWQSTQHGEETCLDREDNPDQWCWSCRARAALANKED